MDVRRLVGKNVKEIRRGKGWTQEKLAEISGVPQQYISGLERGEKNPTLLKLHELAQGLGVPVADLVREAGSSTGGGADRG